MNEEEIKNNEEEKINSGNTDKTEKAEEIDDVSFEDVNDEGEVDIKATIKKLRERVKTLEKEKQEYLLGWQRSQADYANLKKENESNRVSLIKFANKRLIEDMLPALDAYTMAKGNVEAWNKVESNWRVGIEYIFGQLNSVLEKEGLVSFGKVGEKFNPNLHESVEVIPTDDESKNDTIESILANGYKFGDTIVRPAKVKTWGYKI